MDSSLSSDPNFEDQFTGDTSAYDVRLSCIEGNSVFPGAGNINQSPLFVNDSLGDLRLLAGSPCIDSARNGSILSTDPSDLDQDGVTNEDLPLDLSGVVRRLDDPNTPETGSGAAPVVDMGAHEFDPGP